MRKEKYTEAELEIIRFSSQDVIMTTGGDPLEDDEVSGQAP